MHMVLSGMGSFWGITGQLGISPELYVLCLCGEVVKHILLSSYIGSWHLSYCNPELNQFFTNKIRN